MNGYPYASDPYTRQVIEERELRRWLEKEPWSDGSDLPSSEQIAREAAREELYAQKVAEVHKFCTFDTLEKGRALLRWVRGYASDDMILVEAERRIPAVTFADLVAMKSWALSRVYGRFSRMNLELPVNHPYSPATARGVCLIVDGVWDLNRKRHRTMCDDLRSWGLRIEDGSVSDPHKRALTDPSRPSAGWYVVRDDEYLENDGWAG